MSTIGPGSGQQHLIALLRSIRAKLTAEAAEAAQPRAGQTTEGAAGGAAAKPGHGLEARLVSHVPAGQPVPVLGRPGTTATGPPATPGGTPPSTAPPAPPAPGTPPTPPGPAPVGLHPPGHPVVGGDHPDGDAVLRDLKTVLQRCLAEAGPLDDLAARYRDALARAQPDLLIPLPGTPDSRRDQIAAALAWFVDNLDRPQAVAAGCGQLGGVLREWGVSPQQTQLAGAALAEVLRAGLGQGWSREYDAALRTAWRLAHRWLADGAEAAAYTPVVWSGTVVGHERRLPDLAVLKIRPYLPYRFLPGQFTRIEVGRHPQTWRPYSLAGAPRFDNVLEVHVRAKAATTVSGSLVYDTRVGDRVRLRAAAGEMVLDPGSARDLLMIAGDTGVAPFKALLSELAVTADPRTAMVFWGVRTLADLYDVAELDAIAASCRRATVVPVVSDGDPGPYPSGLVTDAVAAYGEWSGADVLLAGPPVMVAATTVVLESLLGIDRARIRHDPAAL